MDINMVSSSFVILKVFLSFDSNSWYSLVGYRADFGTEGGGLIPGHASAGP